MTLSSATRSNGAMLVAILSMTFLASAQQTAQQILSESGISAGLCIHVGCVDGSITRDLHNNGTIVVQGLTTNASDAAKARAAARDAGLYGLVTISLVAEFAALPYRNNLVNLVIADLDNLGATGPSETEIQRILAPLGVAYVKKGGSWKKTIKPRPSGLDTWTNTFHGPDGNTSSSDQTVGVATGLQWLGGFGQQIPARGTAFSAERMIVNERQLFTALIDPDLRAPVKADFDQRPYRVVSRDAFNGVGLWRAPVSFPEKHTAFSCDATRLLVSMGPGKPLQAYDAKTGKVAVTYTNGSVVTSPPKPASRSQNGFQGMIIDGKMVQAQGEKLSVLDAATGALAWEWNAGAPVAYPRSVPGSGKLWIAVGTSGWTYTWQADPTSAESARFPSFPVQKLVCFNLSDGKQVLQSVSLGGKYYSNMMISNGRIILWDSGKTGDTSKETCDDNGGPKAFCIDAATGKEIWHIFCSTVQSGANMLPGVNSWGGRAGFVMGDKFVMDGFTFHSVADGKMTVKAQTPSQKVLVARRCESSSGTPKYSLFKGLVYIKPNGEWIVNEIARPSCALFPVPANGFIYYNPQACGCSSAFIRNYVVTTSEPTPEPIPDAQRLMKSGLSGLPAGSDIKSPLITLPSSPVVFDWSRNFDYSIPLKAAVVQSMPDKIGPTEAGGLSFTVLVHEHRVEARQGSELKWTFTAGGRISTIPGIDNENAYIASHDGYVYCVGLSNGALKWKFLAAARDLRMAAFSQVESVWPVYGVAVENGKVYFSAGRHPDADGGVHVYKVDGATGALQFHAIARTDRKWRTSTSGYNPPRQQFTNTAPKCSSGVVTITTFTCNTITGAMTLNGIAYTKVPELVAVISKGNGLSYRLTPGQITSISLGKGTAFNVEARLAAHFEIVDAKGRRLVSRDLAAGEKWLSAPVNVPGLYLARLRCGEEFMLTKTIMVDR